MYYEINVSLNGRHFFATAPRSITTYAELKKVLPVIIEKFPASEGYVIMLTQEHQSCTILNILNIEETLKFE